MNTALAPSSDDQLAHQGLRRANNDRVFDWLKDLYENVRNFLRAPAVLLPMIGDARLQAALKENGTDGRVAELVRRLGQDSLVYAEKLKAIHDGHASRRGSSYDADDLMLSISISQRYLAFTSDYETTILPTIAEVLEVLEGAGLDASSVRLMAGTGIVYDLFEQKSQQDAALGEAESPTLH